MPVVSREDDVTVVTITPAERNLDSASISPFADALQQAAIDAEPPWVVVDLTSAVFLGSAFLEALFRGWKRLQTRQGRLALCGLSPICLEVFRVTKLDTLWPICPTRAEAVTALASK